MSDPVSRYWLATGLTPVIFPVENEETGEVGQRDEMAGARRAALERAHEIRKFEIDLYWKRATYFWILQAAVFTALGLTWKFGDTGLSPLIPVALAALGGVTAFAGWLSARGSKFWQENWEHHIDMLEDEFEGRLHKTAYVGRNGIAWSVSGVNDRLALCFVAFWIAILLSTAFFANSDWFGFLPTWCVSTGFQTAFIFLSAIGAGAILYFRKTRFCGAKGIPFHGEVPMYEGSDCIDPEKLPSIRALAKLKRPFLIRREPKI